MGRGIIKKYQTFILVAVILLAGFVSYVNIYSHQFLWDDEFLIQENVFIRSWKNLPQIFSTCSGAGAGRLDNFYRPMQLVVYTTVHSLFGFQPWAFLLTNVLFHLAAGVLIFLLIKKIFKKNLLAFLTALFWIIHPVQTEAVTYISGIADPLFVFFSLISFNFYLNFRQKRQGYFLAFSLVFFILALLSKETAVVLPGLLILYEFLFNSTEKPINGKKRHYSDYQGIVWFVIIAFGYFSLRSTALNFNNSLNFYNESNIYTERFYIRIFTFLASLLMYYFFLFYPVNLHMERSFPVFVSLFSWQVLVSLAILIVLAFVVYKNVKQKKYHLAFGIFWFFIGFLPMSGIIPVNSFLLEHWLYFPSIGFFFCLAAIVHYFWQKYPRVKKIIAVVLAMIVFTLTGLTLKRNTDWKNPIVFYNNILKYEKGSARVHNNLGMAYAAEGDLKKAEEHYLKSIEVGDQYAQVHYNLARLYLQTNKEAEAIEHLEKSVEINPNFFFSYYILGQIYEKKGEIKKSQEYYQKAQEIKYY